jgi:hypothetical protein
MQGDNIINKSLVAFVLVISASFGLALHSMWYYPFFSDDAFISLVYSQRLIEGQGLTWTDGSFVEGYSNLLWVLLTASLGYAGIDLIFAARLICLLSTVGCIITLYIYNQKEFQDTYVPAIGALLLLITNGPIACWSIGGLEATLHALLILLIAVLLAHPKRKYLWIASIALALASLNRPEGLILVPFTIAALFLQKYGLYIINPRALAKRIKEEIPNILAISFIPILACASQIGFRLYYYGDWVPNTFHAKFAMTPERSMGAYTYLWDATIANLPLAILLLIGLLVYIPRIANPITRDIYLKSLKRICPAMLLLIAWLLIVYLGGGDIFPSYRHIVPAIPIVILIISDMIGTSLKSRKISKTETIAILLIASLAGLANHLLNKENIRAKEELYAWAGKQIGEVLNESWRDVSPAPLTAMTCAGAQGYYLRLPALDMHGLNDKNLVKLKNPTFGRGCIGHELINLDYVFSRNPDAIISNVGLAMPEWEMIDYPGFQDKYQLVRLSKMPSSIGVNSGFQPYVFIRKDRLKDMLKPWMEPLPWTFVSNRPATAKNIMDLRTRHLENKPRAYDIGLQTGKGLWFQGNQIIMAFKTKDQRETMRFPAEKGLWDVYIKITKASDYGILKLTINNSAPVEIDGFSKGIGVSEIKIPRVELAPSDNTLNVIVTGRNKLSTGYFAGIDNIRWENPNP